MRFFVTAPQGTEAVLLEELRELGLSRIKPRGLGAEFSGRFADAFRVCLHSRIAGRVLWTLAEFPLRGEQDLYDAVREITWEEHLDEARTLSVRAAGSAPGLTHTNFVGQRTKDAIVDRLRDRIGARPSVSRDDPDVGVFVRLSRGRGTVSLDLSGQSLHRRGFRGATGAAPLKENVAAAVVRLSGWDRKTPFVDPMCGAGTLCIEADHWARRVAPGLARERFGFQRWLSHDARLEREFARLVERAKAAAVAEGPEVVGSDHQPLVIAAAQEHAQAAGARVQFRLADVSALASTVPAGTVCSNTPYGERIHAPDSLWQRLADALAAISPGHHVAMLLGPGSKLRVPPYATSHALLNGTIECRLARWTT
ncbi:MAG: THUMP domain-containing protein [Polyangiaceae bacterium]